MNALSLRDAAARISTDLAQSPPVREACYRVLNWVQNQPEGATSHVSVQRLRNAAALVDMSHFAWMVRYLTGARVPLFDVVYEFVDDEIIEVVSADDLHEARNTGEFYHPITGELVCDYESKVVVYFSVSKAAAAIRSKKR